MSTLAYQLCCLISEFISYVSNLSSCCQCQSTAIALIELFLSLNLWFIGSHFHICEEISPKFGTVPVNCHDTFEPILRW